MILANLTINKAVTSREKGELVTKTARINTHKNDIPPMFIFPTRKRQTLYVK